jgi:hypothetical protein
MTTLMIAIDPGRSGGIAARYPDGRTAAWAMPAEDADVLDLLRELARGARTKRWGLQAALEKVGGYVGGKGQPGSAMFTFGASYGFLLGALMALEVPLVLVRPQQWQGALQLGKAALHPSKPAWKRHLRAEAARRHPHLRPTLATSDALLMLDAALLLSTLPLAPCDADSAAGPETRNETAQTRKEHVTK